MSSFSHVVLYPLLFTLLTFFIRSFSYSLIYLYFISLIFYIPHIFIFIFTYPHSYSFTLDPSHSLYFHSPSLIHSFIHISPLHSYSHSLFLLTSFTLDHSLSYSPSYVPPSHPSYIHSSLIYLYFHFPHTHIYISFIHSPSLTYLHIYIFIFIFIFTYPFTLLLIHLYIYISLLHSHTHTHTFILNILTLIHTNIHTLTHSSLSCSLYFTLLPSHTPLYSLS